MRGTGEAGRARPAAGCAGAKLAGRFRRRGYSSRDRFGDRRIGIRVRLAFLRGVRCTSEASRARAATSGVLPDRVVSGSVVSAAVATSASASASAATTTLSLGRIERRRRVEEIDRHRRCDERQRQHTNCRNSATRETMFHNFLHVAPAYVPPKYAYVWRVNDGIPPLIPIPT